MEDKKVIISIQTKESIRDKLKVIAEKEKRSQAKTMEILIEDKFKTLGK